jgi:transcriptional regulator with XRE-family HTH domain
MTSIREILATNLKESRRRLGWTQEKLAEQADVSTHYIAMIETCNKYPKPEMLERIAQALNVEPHSLFSAPTTLDEALEHLRQLIVTDIKQVVREVLQETISSECKNRDKE